MRLPLTTCIVRSWEVSDAASVPAHANNRRIWLNLRDRFPHPYTRSDSERFIRYVRGCAVETSFAIEVDGEAAGGISVMPNHDVERLSAEIGYWLGERHWGRGICTEVVAAVTQYALAQYQLTRIYALPFAHNLASCRVLEKSGYVLEGTMRRSAIKDGQICDQKLYAYVGPEPLSPEPTERP
jgi:ribosomal-protein-alanine N-acetyltransferase